MSHLVNEIEGLSPFYSEKLHEVGIDTTDDLLNMGEQKKRDELADKIGIDTNTLLKWINTADLFRVHGIGKQTSQLLKAVGIETIAELCDQDAMDLSHKLRDINMKKRLSKINPSPRVVQHWIEQAKRLKIVIK